MSVVSTHRAHWLGRCILPHEPALRAWLSRRALADLDIDDVVQETYAVLAALQSVEHIRDPRSYMFQVAKSVILQALRRSRVVPLDLAAEAMSILQTPSDEPGPEQITADRQELARVARLIETLPPRVRRVFVARKVQGLSQREAAGALGLSESTIEKHMARALFLLPRMMMDGGNPRFGASTDRDPKLLVQDRHARDRR